MGILCSLATIDEESLVVEEALDGLESIIDLVGPSILQSKINDVMEVLKTGWQGKLSAQEDDLQDNPDVDAEDCETTVMERVSDVTCCLGKVLGNLFGEYFDALIESIALATESPLEMYRRSAFGCIGGVLQEVPEVGQKYLNDLYTILENGTRDTSIECRRNSVYALGLYTEILPKETVQASTMEILKTFYAVLNTAEGEPKQVEALQDNTISSVIRLMMVATDVFPYEDVLPILIANVPLKNDHQEDENVYRGILYLVESIALIPAVRESIPAILDVYGLSLAEKRIKDDVKNQYIGPGLQKLYAEYTQEVNNAFDTFSPEAQSATKVLLGL